MAEKFNYETPYRQAVADLEALKTQADNAGNDANAIGKLADRVTALAESGRKTLDAIDAPPAEKKASTPPV